LGQHDGPGSTTGQERYHPLKGILARDKKGMAKKVHEIDTSTDRWLTYILKGLVGIALAAILFAWPEETLLFLVVAFGIQAIAKGIIGLVHTVSLAAAKERWFLVSIESGVGLLLGVALVLQPHASLNLAAVLIGMWMIGTGISQMAIAFRDRNAALKWLLSAGGLLSFIIGVLLVAVPIETVHLAHTLSAVQALVLGIIFMIAGFYVFLQSLKQREKGSSATHAPSS
jgi:uncharacterized membrane protein HdeD (DUF308 family)